MYEGVSDANSKGMGRVHALHMHNLLTWANILARMRNRPTGPDRPCDNLLVDHETIWRFLKAMPSFKDILAAQTPSNADTPADWSKIHEDHRARFIEKYGENVEQDIVDALAVSFPAAGFVPAKRGGKRAVAIVDFEPLHDAILRADQAAAHLAEAKSVLAEAQGQVRRAMQTAAAATDDRNAALRRLYAEGATATSLANAAGLSQVRVQQIVAGARG